MFKKLLFAAMLFVCNLNFVNSMELPEEFFVKQRWFSFTNHFDIETKQLKLGCVHRKLLSLTPQYLLHDYNDRLQAYAKMRFFAFGAIFDVYDEFDSRIGIVEERIFTFFPTFDMYSTTGFHIAKAKMNFWGTIYTITDPLSERVVATLSRSFFRLRDNWTVNIIDPGFCQERHLDPRFFIVVMAFQTDLDYWRARRVNFDNDLNSLNEEISFATEEKFHNLKYQISQYSEEFGNYNPSDEEITNIEEIVEKHFQSLAIANDYDYSIEGISAKWNDKIRLEKGISTLLPLLSSDTLSYTQKCTLYTLIEQTVN